MKEPYYVFSTEKGFSLNKLLVGLFDDWVAATEASRWMATGGTAKRVFELGGDLCPVLNI